MDGKVMASGGPATLIALGLALLMACMNDPDPAVDGTVRGALRDDCGPADGQMLNLRMDRTQALTCADWAPGEYKLGVDDIYLDSLRAGQALKDTIRVCNESGCTPVLEYLLEVEGVDSAQVRGTVEITEHRAAGPIKKRYKAELKKCPRPTYFCG